MSTEPEPDVEGDEPRSIDIRDSRGVQVGDHGLQINNIYYPAASPGDVASPLVKVSGEIHHGLHGMPNGPGPVTLPAGPERFTGRDSLLLELLGRLDPSRDEAGVTVVSAVEGMGGVGKTTLAVHAARVAYDRGWFPGGALYLDMRGFSLGDPVDYGAAAAHLLRSLGVPDSDVPAAAEDRRAAWHRRLAELGELHRPLLTVLDNTAHAGQVRKLLPPNPHRMLITSRSTLSMLDDAYRVVVEPFSPDDAVRFIENALRTARPGDDRAVADARGAYRLAELCGYLPLALRIVVALLRDEPGRPLGSLSAELADEDTRIGRLRYDDVDEQGQPLAVKTAFDLSYRYLADSPDQARAFRLLAAVPGANVSPAAAAAALGLAVPDARRLLAELARRHWLETLPGERWGWHDLVRLYGEDRAHDHAVEDSREEAVERIYSYWRDGVNSAAAWLRSYGKARPLRPGGFGCSADAVAWLDGEHQSLVAAVAAASAARRWDDAHQLAAGLAGYQEFRHLTDDGIAVATLGLAAAPHLGRRRECESEMRLGDAYRIAGRYAEAVGHLERALQLCSADYAIAEGSIRHNLGLAYLRLGRFAEAEACHRRDLKICREAGDWRGAGEAMIALGDALQELGQFREAAAVLNTAVETFEVTGDLRNVELARTNLALTCLNGFPDTRAAYIIWQLCMALRAARDLDDRKGQALILLNLASAYLNRCRGCHGRSAARWSLHAAEMFHVMGDGAGEERATRNAALVKSQGDETAHEACPGDGTPGSANLRAWLDDLPHAVLRGADSRLDEARFFGNIIIGPTLDGSPLPGELLRRNKTGLFLTAEDLTGEESGTILSQAGLGDAAAARAAGAALGHDGGAVAMAAAFLRRGLLPASAFIERLNAMTVDDDPGRPAGPGAAGAAKMAVLAVEAAEQAAPYAGRVLDVLALLAPGSVDMRRLAREFSSCDTADIDAAVYALADTAAIIIDGNEITANPAAARTARRRAARRGTILDAAATATRMVDSEISTLEGTAVPVDRVAVLSQQINTMWAAVGPELAGRSAQDTGAWAVTANMMRLRTWQVNFLAQSAGRPADAAELGDAVLDDCTRLLGESHQETWRARNNIAGACFAAGDFDRACALFSRNIRPGDTSADYQDRLLTRHNLGVAHERAGRPKRAAQVLANVLADRERILGTRHPDTLETRHWLGVANAGIGNLPEATRLLEEAAAGRRSIGRPSVNLAGTLEVLAELYTRSGLTDEAIQAMEESVAIKEDVFKPGNTGVIVDRDKLAELYLRTRKFKKAVMLLQRNFTEAEQSQGPDAEIAHLTRQRLQHAQQEAEKPRRQS